METVDLTFKLYQIVTQKHHNDFCDLFYGAIYDSKELLYISLNYFNTIIANRAYDSEKIRIIDYFEPDKTIFKGTLIEYLSKGVDGK